MSAALLATFCGTAVSLTLAVPLAQFHTHSMYDALTRAKRERDRKRERVSLNKVARGDLLYWPRLGPEGSGMRELASVACVHSDAADLRWGGTFGRDMRPGTDGRHLQGWWDVVEKNKTIAFRELRALRLVLGGFCRASKEG